MSGGCSSTTDGTPTAPATQDTQAATAALWDPCTIPHETWQQVGVAPSTLSPTIAGSDHVDGFKHCGGHDVPWTFGVDVWSQIYSVDDYRHKESGTTFQPVTIAGRDGFEYHKTADECNLIFASKQGSYSVEVLKQDPESAVVPCDQATTVANAIIPLFPK
ncbi:DUF3558 domain-containing protein [Nocardia nova]|uniref:DUF3558 domain-containing protein n=1 Tax=Nocardia nova TaxID=37330 RepID=UPI001C4839D4|nr:DUF3558 domain-containing protein [Nocardia nova]MBV7706466.1 DUF3558 domain-containing protein [Nocardia nova]